MRYLSLAILSATLFLAACAPTSQTPTVDNARAAKEADIQREIALKDSRQYFGRLQKDVTIQPKTACAGKAIVAGMSWRITHANILNQNAGMR